MISMAIVDLTPEEIIGVTVAINIADHADISNPDAKAWLSVLDKMLCLKATEDRPIMTDIDLETTYKLQTKRWNVGDSPDRFCWITTAIGTINQIRAELKHYYYNNKEVRILEITTRVFEEEQP